MKLIFSRKGFDSSAGGVPSPLIDDRPVSLPIPTRMPSRTRYRDLPGGIANIASDLTKGRITPDRPCHLDPDLNRGSLPRLPGWRGALGQVGAAQGHLANQRIGAGDLFLFWGIFRPAARAGEGRRWEFFGAKEHRIFGWLQIGEVVAVGEDPRQVLAHYPWLAAHPHVAEGWSSSNTVYVASSALNLPGIGALGAGFGQLRKGIRLTPPGAATPSEWILPTWLNPRSGGVGLTYNPLERWTPEGRLKAAARGQEFIADIDDRADAIQWLAQILAKEV